MGVGMRIKIALREKKMTIKELSAQSGISLNTLYSITKRDTENVDDVILSMISKTLGLPEFFFLGFEPYEDLDFLQRNKEKILLELQEQGFVPKNEKNLNSFSNYEFWEVVSNAFSIFEDESGRINVLCEVSLGYDPYSDDADGIDELLKHFIKLDFRGRKLVIEYAELLASNPGFLDKQSSNKLE